MENLQNTKSTKLQIKVSLLSLPPSFRGRKLMRNLFFGVLLFNVVWVQTLTIHSPQLLTVAKQAAIAAGVLIAASTPALKQTKLNSRDVLTQTDLNAERVIKETILATFPAHPILSEEDVEPGAACSAVALDKFLTLDHDNAEYGWIVDPLDGTTNFLHSLEHSAPSIACVHLKTREVVAGAIFDPYKKELFHASTGKGAFLNDVKVTQKLDQATLVLSQSLVAMGSPPAKESLEMSRKGSSVLMDKVRSLRMTGSAALMLAYVGIARFDAYWEYDLSSWDVSAGNLFIRESGGDVVTISTGESCKIDDRQILAFRNGGKSMSNELRATLNNAGVI